MKSGTQMPAWSSNCLEPDILLDLIEATQGNVRPEQRTHIDGCALCRENFEQMLEMWHLARMAPPESAVSEGHIGSAETAPASLLPTRRRKTSPGVSISAGLCALLAVAGISLIGLYKRQQSQNQSLTLLGQQLQALNTRVRTQDAYAGDQQARLQQAQIQLQQSQEQARGWEEALTHQKQEAAQHLAKVQQAYQQKLHAAQVASQQSVPVVVKRGVEQNAAPLIARLAANLNTATLGAGHPQESVLALYAPVRVIVPENIVTFSWQAVPDVRYKVEVRRPDGSLAKQSAWLTAPQWQTVLSGNTLTAVPYYTWSVTTSSNMSSSGARFVVLPEDMRGAETAHSGKQAP